MKRTVYLNSGILLFCVIFILTTTISFTQSYMVHRYSESDGLASAYVNDIAQDKLGRMWFATRAGIALYDGISWSKFTVSDGLPVLSFLKIKIDRSGRVWALSDPINGGAQIVFFDGYRWNLLPEPEQFDINLSEISTFSLLETGEENSSEIPVLVLGTTGQGVFVYVKGEWRSISTINGLLSNNVNGLAVFQGKLFATTNNGLSIISQDLQVDNQLSATLGLNDERILGIAVQYKDAFDDNRMKESRVWLYGERWLGYFDETNVTLVRYPLELRLSDREPSAILLPDYRSGIYIGDRFVLGYFNFNRGTWELLDAPNGLAGGGTNSLYIDFEKNVWIACDRGVSKISSRRFTNFQRIHGLLEDEVTAIMEYRPGKFVLGHNYGLTFYDGHDFIEVPFQWDNEFRPMVVRVMDMALDAENNIWIAVSWGGLAKINPDYPNKIRWYHAKDGLPDKITTLWIDKGSDQLWVGTGEGTFLLTRRKYGNQSEKLEINKGKKYPFCDVRRIFGDRGNLHYIASHSSGMYMYDQTVDQWVNYNVPGNINANAVYAIKKSSSGRIFVGTLDGLYTLEKERLIQFKSNGFSLNRPVFFILEDQRHRLWFGTDNGVVRWNGQKVNGYSMGQGLIGRETNRAAGISDSFGRIWIGTNLGLSIYDDAFDDESFVPKPKIRLSFLDAGGKHIPLISTRPVHLAFDDNTVAFHFRGISFLDEIGIRFKNKLEGYEKDWSEESYPYKQIIRYINLPPGKYRFHLKASNVMGTWSDEVISSQIIIAKPFYKTWWFFLLLMLPVASIFYAVFRYFSQKRYATVLEQQVEERTRQLQVAEKQYRSLFEESKDTVFVSTISGKLLDINPAGLELFGYKTKDEVLEIDSIRDLYYNTEYRDQFIAEISEKGFVKDYEILINNKDGEPLIVWVTATTVRNSRGEVYAFRGIIRDITRQKKLEQQLIQAQKMEAIGTLAGGIAHDFNNILGAIIGYAELVMEDAPTNTLLKQNAQSIFNAAQRAAELVKQILAFSRQSAQKRKPIHMGGVIKEALKLLRSTLPATIEIREFIEPENSAILGDPTQIHQVMMNLAANAAHAMKMTGGILEVTLQQVDLLQQDITTQSHLSPGTYLRLSVSDTGHGIPQVVMKRIFEPYFTTKETGEGTGLGLAVIHGIVKSHKGDISVYSEPGKGTTFHVYFPKLEDNSQHDSSKPLPEKIPGGNERILLVDDEAALIEAGTRMLERLGYQVEGFTNPLGAIEIYQKSHQRFQLVITDLTMPQMTGLQLAEKMRKVNPGIPIVICSGFSTALDSDRFKAMGINDFVMKPIVRSELARVVRKVLDRT